MRMHVGVVGRGLMGVGIAEVSARAALDVVVAESNDAAPKAGVARLEESLQYPRPDKSLQYPRPDNSRWMLGYVSW